MYLIYETFKCECSKHTNKIINRSIDLLFTFKFFSMNKTQINKSRMYGATDLSLDTHSILFAEYGELVTAHQRLKSALEVININRQVQEADNSGLTKGKTELRKDLIRRILRFSGALRAYATGIKDIDLKTKANYSFSDLRNSADSVLLDIGVLLFELADPIRSGLLRFSMGDDEFTSIASLLIDFKQAIPQKRVASNVSKVSTSNISDVYKSLDKLLKDEIDELMLPYQFMQPDFYNAYKNARTIVNYSGRGKSKPDDPTTPAESPMRRNN